ncbi:MAG: hypothetical protein HY820_00490 [Acidobacteria bacterium]|nr:hypothetical protein [Acidobacteriota bacterium]
MTLRSHPLAEFWNRYDALPQDIQERADKQFALFETNPNHSSLRFKEIGPYWSVRVNRSYRALARRRGNDLYWFWIGHHDEYERILKW